MYIIVKNLFKKSAQAKKTTTTKVFPAHPVSQASHVQLRNDEGNIQKNIWNTFIEHVLYHKVMYNSAHLNQRHVWEECHSDLHLATVCFSI